MSSNFEEIIEKTKPYAELLSQVSNSAVFIVDKFGTYYYLSDRFSLFGYQSSDLNIEQYPYYLNQRIHPDDLVALRSLQIQLFELIYNLQAEEQNSYKHIFEFRGLAPNNEYIRVISQHQLLAITPDNFLLLGIVDISPDQTPDLGIRFRLMNINTGKIVPFSINNNTDISLTKREIEILQLANSGMFSKDISEKLSISINTVNRHRQNILQKMNADNIIEATAFARKLGLLD